MKQSDILCSITATLYPSYLEGLTCFYRIDRNTFTGMP